MRRGTGTETNEGNAGVKVRMAAHQDGQRCYSFSFAELVNKTPPKYTFRYKSENRSRGTITIKIRVNDYIGRVKAVLACVTEDYYGSTPMPHPNQLKCGRRCEDGVCSIQTYITPKNNVIVFNQIGIQRVKKTDLEEAMRERTSNTDFPFVREYKRIEETIDVKMIKTGRVRLACQVLIEDALGALTNPLKVVETDLITHYPEQLKIIHASHDSGAASGGLRVFLLTAKLPTSVVVVFRETDSEWQAQGLAVQQHMKVALQFTTPPYRDLLHYGPVTVYYYMAVTVDSEDEQKEENRRHFTYLPTITDKDVLAQICNKPLDETLRNILLELMSKEPINETLRNILVGVNFMSGGGEPAAVHQDAEYRMECMDTNSAQLDDSIPFPSGHIPEHQHHADDVSIPSDEYEFWFQSQEANEVDAIARQYLVDPFSISSLPGQSMEQEMAGSEELPG